jgi:hypothetical protein
MGFDCCAEQGTRNKEQILRRHSIISISFWRCFANFDNIGKIALVCAEYEATPSNIVKGPK